MTALPASSVVTDIPTEVWCHIFEYLKLEVDGLDALTSCALTCSAFVYPSQRLLFQEKGLADDYRLSPILDRYITSPHLAKHLRHLCVYDKHGGTQWSGVSKELPVILDMFSNVHTLSLQTRDPPCPPWLRSDDLLAIPNTRRSEKGLLFTSLRSVQTILISEYSVLYDTALPEVLNEFQQLQTLVILQLYGRTSYDASPNPTFNLKSLRIQVCSDFDFLRWLSPALACLTHLSVARETAFDTGRYLPQAGVQSKEEISFNFESCMKSIGQSITHLTIDSSEHDDRLDEFASIVKHTPRLQCLTIIGVRTCNRPLFEALIQVLKQSYSSLLPFLKHIVLNCFLHAHEGPQIHIDKSMWNQLETAIIHSEGYAQVERGQRQDKLLLTLDLDFVIKTKHSPLPDNYSLLYHTIEERVLDALPLLVSRSMVHVYRSGGRWYGLRRGPYWTRDGDRDITSY